MGDVEKQVATLFQSVARQIPAGFLGLHQCCHLPLYHPKPSLSSPYKWLYFGTVLIVSVGPNVDHQPPELRSSTFLPSCLLVSPLFLLLLVPNIPFRFFDVES